MAGREAPDSATGAARLAVLGSPIAHSRSPRIHAAAYRVLGLPWSYEAIECDEAGLEPLLAGMGAEWRGLSLTMPLKEEAHRLATVLDPVAEESGVVNTLLRVLGGTSGESRWAGFNTDVGGLAAAIRDAGLDASHTIVIGSGATAVSAILAARRLGARHVEVVARNTGAVGDLVARFGDTREGGGTAPLHVRGTPLHAVAPVDFEAGDPSCSAPPPTLVISTLPGSAASALELPESFTAIPLFDVAYEPWPSPLAERWRAAGGEAHAGIGMLVRQALLQVRIFVGGDPGIPLEREDEVLAAMEAASG